MANIDNYYRSAVTYTQSPPTTDTFSTNFNYSTVQNQYGSDILLYTGLIPTTNPLVGSPDGAKYSDEGIEIVEKISVQQLSSVEESAFGFTHSRLTYLIPGSVFGITVWSKDGSGNYTVPVPNRYYDVFFYPSTETYAIYFKDTSYEPMYRTADGLVALQYPPAITCYRYCGPKGIENIAGGGNAGLAGTQYIYVAANGTDTENATELQSAYNTAKTMSPSSATRITIIAAPGNYNFESTPFVMDTEYIDLVPLSDGSTMKSFPYRWGNDFKPSISSIVFNSSDPMGTIVVNTNNALVKGIDVVSKPFIIADYWTETPINFNGTLQIEDCSGGDNSFGSQISHPTIPDVGTMTGALNANFTNCKGGDYSFCASSLSTIPQPTYFYGTLQNCVAGDYSFGSTSWATSPSDVLGASIDVQAIDCVAGTHSWGYYSYDSSNYTRCEGGEYSFGYGGDAGGEYRWCYADSYSFGASGYGNIGYASGQFHNCEAFDDSFGYGGVCTGTFINCKGGSGSFGGGIGTLTGKLFYCRLTSGLFQTPTESGVLVACIDGNDDFFDKVVPTP